MRGFAKKNVAKDLEKVANLGFFCEEDASNNAVESQNLSQNGTEEQEAEESKEPKHPAMSLTREQVENSLDQ